MGHVFGISDGYGDATGKSERPDASDLGIIGEHDVNEEFYNHLLNLFNSGEINGVFCPKSRDGYVVKFTFYEYPNGYHGGLYYKESIEDNWPMYKINRHWGLEMIPNM